MSVQEPSHYAEEDMVLVAGSDYIRMASIGGGLLSIKLPTVGDSTPIVEGVSGELLAVNGGTYVDQGRLAVTHIRESGDGTGISLPGNIMMYNPNGNPKEITYSNDIPIRLNTFDVSLNGHDDRLNELDISVNIIDVSLNVHDDRLNGLDISVNIIDVSLNIHDVSLNIHDASLNILDTSVNIIDVSLNDHNNRLNNNNISLNILDTSVNIIDVSLNDHNNRLNNNNISLNVLDTSVNIIDVSLNELIDQGGVSYGATFAIGAGSSATGTNSFAIGNNATTGSFSGAVAIGNGSTVEAPDEYKFGNSSNINMKVYGTGNGDSGNFQGSFTSENYYNAAAQDSVYYTAFVLTGPCHFTIIVSSEVSNSYMYLWGYWNDALGIDPNVRSLDRNNMDFQTTTDDSGATQNIQIQQKTNQTIKMVATILISKPPIDANTISW